MKTSKNFKHIFASVLCLAMVLAMLPVTASAAKAKFNKEIELVKIDGIDAPKAGEPFDFTATVNSNMYKVVAVVWQRQYNDRYLSQTSIASAGVKYSVQVYLEVTDSDYYFSTASGRVSDVEAYINGEQANCDNTIDRTVWAIDASKYDHDTTYEKALRVIYTFEEVEGEEIESAEFYVPAPVHGEKVPTTFRDSGIKINSINGKEPKGLINVNSIEWTHQSGKPLAGNATFKAGEKYTLKMELGSLYGVDFATNPNHILSQPGKPFPDVDIEINGKSATVLPDTDAYGNYVVIAAMVFECEYNVIEKLEVTGISAPKTGAFPSYVAIVRGDGAKLAAVNSGTTKNGITWIESGSSAVPVNGFTFESETQYIVKIEIEAEDGYIFDDPKVTIDGRTGGVEVDGDEERITVTYAFAATGKDVVSSVRIEDIDAPKAGKVPDYTATLEDERITFADSNDRFTKSGIYWYNVTDKKAMYVGADKFEDGKVYSVTVEIWTNDDYIFDYTNKGTACNVRGYVNGKSADDVYGRSNEEVFVEYIFPAVGTEDEEEKPTTTEKDKETEKNKETEKVTDKEKEEDAKLKVIDKITVTGVNLAPADLEDPLAEGVKISPDNVEISEFKWATVAVGTWKPGVADIYLIAPEGYKFSSETVLRINGYYAKAVAVSGDTAIFQCIFADVFKENPADHFHTHYYGHSAFEHWLECACGEAEEFAKHTFDAEGKCGVCGFKRYDISKLPFSDVKSSDYFAQAVGWAFENGITTGTSATTFTPEATCSRGQVVTFLWRAAGCPEPKSTKNPFQDVKQTDYFYKAVLWAVEQKITNGTSAKAFSPDNTCSTADILTFLFRAAGAGKNGWYEEAADWADYNDLLLATGLEVNPSTPCPRSAVVTFLYRIYG